MSRAGAEAATQDQGGDGSAKDLAVGLLADLLAKSLGDEPAEGERIETSPRERAAEIALRRSITNAFSLTAEIAGGS